MGTIDQIQNLFSCMSQQIYHHNLILEIRRRLIGECQERTLKCLDLLTEAEIWHRPNDKSNSVGNLVLHLCGNVRQWLFSTLGGQADVRQRQVEFDARESHDRASLKNEIVDLMYHADKLLSELRVEDVLQTYSVQGFEENGISILVHVTEHFSYHVGQMTYFVKAHKNLDVAYYAGLDLDKTR